MSLWSVLGGVGKAVGKVALGTVGSVVGVSGLANVFDSKGVAAAPVAAAPSLAAVAAPMQPVYQSDLDKGVTITASPLSSSSLPSWLLPAGIGLLAVLLITNNKR